MTFAEWQSAISKALGEGDVLAPEALLRVLDGQADPTALAWGYGGLMDWGYQGIGNAG